MNSWEDACAASRYDRAVSEPRQFEVRGKTFIGEIIKPKHGDPFWTFKGRPGSRVRQATAAETDVVQRWSPY